ncbi:response regulator transcription factor [Bradyrhizobium sp. WSM1743]|uniref:response regulator transcription factor n=1 Tax=Bradyrhizobium sp. WSM1743 TaxID=318996 RepID=UPI000406677A|nr:response regulator transcription factor [Bradyrhizobium sp. WSM1743]
MLDVTAKQGISARIRLVIGDRQPIVLQGLKSVLGAQQDFDVVASCSDGTSCLEAIRNLAPDVALLAETLPDLTVSEILAIAKAENLSTRLVFFTEAESDHDLAAAIAADTCSAISKDASPDTMLRSLRLMTKRSVSPEEFDLLPTGKDTDGGGKIEKMLELLTHRERQIVRLVSEGMSNKEIARQLNLSPGTVKVHLYNIFQKLEITNRTVLATLALLQRPSGFGTLALAFLAIAIADELKASEANDMLPNDDSIGHAGEHAEYEPWKKAILRHLIVWESAETPPLTQRDYFAKLNQIADPAAAIGALPAAEQSLGSKPWKDHGPAGSSAPSLAALSLRGMNDTQIGGVPPPEHQVSRLASNPMSLHGEYGAFATLAGALIYALHDPHLAVPSHEPGQASIDSFLAATGENAATKLAAITNADANHVENSASGFLAHDSRPPSALVTTENESVAGEGARGQMNDGAAGDNLQKPLALLDFGHDADIGGYSRGQLIGGSVEEKVVHRSPIDSNSTSSSPGFDFASGPSRINLAAFGALAWLHMTAASKSIPPHTLAWIYNPASNETIIYVNPTDHVLDIGDHGLLEIHLQGIVSIADSDVVHHPEGTAVAITLEELEAALIPVAATDESVLSADNVHGIVGTSESTIGTEGIWTRLADDGLRLQFGQTRGGSGASSRFRTFTSDSADATEESDGASRVSVRGSSIEPAHGATAATFENLTFKSEPIKTDIGILSAGPNEVVGPSVVTDASAGRGNSQHASEPEPAKAAAAESANAGSKPGNGVGNVAEHHAPASKATPGSTKTADPGGAEHGKSGHAAAAASAPEAVEIDQDVATAASAGRGNSQHASEPGPAKAAAAESAEAGAKPGNGVGNGAEHRAPASDASRGSAKTAEQGGAEHGHSGHDSHSSAASAPAAAEIVELSVASAHSAGRGNSQHALEPGPAKAATTEKAEARSTPDHGVGNDNEHHSSASDGSRGAAKTEERSGVDHGNSGHHPSSANAPAAAEIVESSIASADSVGRGNSQHALEPGPAKAAATEKAEARSTSDHGIGNGAEHRAAASDGAGAPAAEKTAEPAVAEHGSSGHSISANSPEAGGIAAGGDAGGGNAQQAAQSAATASEAAQPAKAASETGGVDQDLVFRFDSEAAPSTPVAAVEPKEFHAPLDPRVPLGHEEDLEMIVKMVPHALDEHTANHGNNGPHHGIVPAPHDLLI